MAVAALSAAALSACGGGGSSAPIATAPTAPTIPTIPTGPSLPSAPYDTAEYFRQPALDQIKAIDAYQAGAFGQNVVVSVIDSGIDVDNPEFAGRIHPQSADLVISGVVQPGDVRVGGPDLNDHDDHGTPVAGIIAAAKNNVGIHGIAPLADLLIFRTDDDGPDSALLFGEAIDEGVDRSISVGADVVNMSFGSNEPGARPEFANMLSRLKSADIVTVLAAGNDSANDPDLSSLGALDVAGAPAAIIAGAVNSVNALAGFSNKAGVAANIFLVAPGVGLRGVAPDQPAGTTRSFSGTSASTPVIAGAAALIRSRWPHLTAAQVVDILLSSATDLGAPGTDAVYGRGLLNLDAAVAPLGAVTTSSASGAEVDPTSLGVTLSDAYGSSLQHAGAIIIFDSYNRDYAMPLANLVARRAPRGFDLEQRFDPFDAYRQSTLPVNAGLILQMRLTSRDIAFASPENALIAGAGIDDDFTDDEIAFAAMSEFGGVMLLAANGFAPATIDRMTIASRNTPFLSDSAFTDAFLPRSDHAVASVMRMSVSPRISMDVLLAHGADTRAEDSRSLFAAAATQADPTVSTMRAGVNFNFAEATLRIEQGLRAERGAILGAVSDESDNASIVYSAIEGAWSPSRRWRLQARYAAGVILGADYGFDAFAIDATQATASQMSISVQRSDLLAAGDRFWIGISEPLQLSAGALRLSLPTGYDRATDTLIYTTEKFGLSPERRRRDFEIGYALATGDFGTVTLNVLHQTFGDFGAEAQTTALIRAGVAY